MSPEKVPPSTGRKLSDPEPAPRILFVAPEPFFENRGTPIALRNVLEAASQRGYEVDLLTFPVGEPVSLPGLRIFRVGSWLPIREVPIGFSIRKVILDLCLLPAILKQTRRVKYSAIYALEEAAFLVLLLGRWHRLPVLYDMQSSLPEQLKAHPVLGRSISQRILRDCEQWMVRKAERIVCSAGLRNYVLAAEPGANVREWHFPGVPEELVAADTGPLRKKLGIAPESKVVLYTGNFEPYQGVERLIEAACKVIPEVPDAVFLLVGDHSSSNFYLPKYVDNLRKKGSLIIVPRQPRSEIPRYLQMADVVVSPRDDIGNIGIKVFEYMAAGKPIIATDTAAHRRVLDEDCAVFVDLSPEEMGRAIVRLLRDSNAAIRYGESARAYAKRHLTRDAFVDQVADLCRLEGIKGNRRHGRHDRGESSR